MSMAVFVQTAFLCISLPVWGQVGPISLLSEPRSVSAEVGMVDQPMLDHNDKANVQRLLNQFLSILNLTEKEPQSMSQADPIETPEYMLELYNHYVNDRRNRPAGNIARSFKNEDSTHFGETSMGVRTHHLMFNVSIPPHEHIIAAELRLFMLLHQDPQHHNRVNWTVTIFEIGVEGMPKVNELFGMQQLLARNGQSTSSGWEVFDVSDAVKKWQQSNHWLEVHVESVSDVALEDQKLMESDDGLSIHLDIEHNSGENHEPVLIVFSDRDHQEQTIQEDNQLNYIGLSVDMNEQHKKQQDFNGVYHSARRTRRDDKNNQCKRTPLYVNFKDIGYDSWIIAPPGYDAYACHGECNFPLLSQTTATRHAIAQTLIHLKDSQRVTLPCCVPTKLEPISILYHENGHVIFQNKYEGMVVAECGCR